MYVVAEGRAAFAMPVEGLLYTERYTMDTNELTASCGGTERVRRLGFHERMPASARASSGPLPGNACAAPSREGTDGEVATVGFCCRGLNPSVVAFLL